MKTIAPLWFHVDMDAFYASVEQRDNPEYRGKPVIIGARPGTRGVVSTCSYEARKYGVHSAMPVNQAHRLCPSAIYISPRIGYYSKISSGIMEDFRDFSPEVIQVSIDEAFINMTGTEGLFGDTGQAARGLKKQVFNNTGLTITVGAAPNRLLAKMASACNKPDGLTIVNPGEELDFILKLDLSDLWGMGKKSLARLEERNIRSTAALYKIPLPMLQSLLGKAAGKYIYSLVRGRDPGIYRGHSKSHSISNEHTFPVDCGNRCVIEDMLFHLAYGIVFRLHRANVHSNTLVLKLRMADFSTSTAQRRSNKGIKTVEGCYELALKLLEKKWDGRSPLRLVGLGFSNVEKRESVSQGEFFDDKTDRRFRAEKAILELQKKYAGLSISKARKFIKNRGQNRKDL